MTRMLEPHPEGVIIVTGGGRGIGAATARLAAQRGFAVCVNFVANERSAHAVVDAIRDVEGRAIAVRADVSREADVIRLFDETVRQFGPLTALVNNAGILEHHMGLADMEA
ncbi:MAG TPA: SDR family NAD(P)-dependent oxidoreductase, partial [Usitatibacter sp.]|nr:SDR family NAD(P)-dependent oxidoreductase [Usitatibacter sp.]